MMIKNNQALDVYMQAGALMRLYKTIGAELYTTVGKVISQRIERNCCVRCTGSTQCVPMQKTTCSAIIRICRINTRTCFTVRRNWSRGTMWTKRLLL